MAEARVLPDAPQKPTKTVHISIDYGTTKIAVAFWIGVPGTQPLDTEIADVKFPGDATSPQKLAFKNRKCHQGHELEEMLRKGKLKQEDVIDYLKVLFYKSHESSDFAERALLQLRQHAHILELGEDAPVDELKIQALAMQLKCLMRGVEQAIENDGEQHFRHTREEIRACPRRIFISVPGMWTPAGNRCMTEAAKKAGLAQVDLVWEPQAAAAYWLQKTKVSGEGIYRAGDMIQVLDVGGGTSDTIAYEVQVDDSVGESDDGGYGGALKLVSMGNANGALAGSEFINQEFLRWVVRRINLEHLTAHYPGGIAAVSTHLGLTDAAVRRLAQADFNGVGGDYAHEIRNIYASGLDRLLENMDISKAEFVDHANTNFRQLKHRLNKHDFEAGSRAVHKVLIDGANNQTAAIEDYKVILKRDEIFGFFEPVLAKNFDLVRQSLETNSNIKTIIVIGGLRHSDYFMSQLAQQFPQVTIIGATNSAVGQPQPVSRGALWAFGIAEAQDLPATDTYGISEDQPYNRAIHTDLAPGETVPGTFEPHVEYAPQRWKTIVACGRRSERTSIWQQRLVFKDEEDLHLQIYWSAVKREEDSAILVAQDSDVTVPGVEKWALLVGVLPNLQQRGFKLQYPKSEQTKQTRQTRQSKRAVAEEDEEYTEGSSKSTSKRKLRTRANAGKPGPKQAKGTPIRASHCTNCKSNIPQSGVCTTCQESARYEVWYRVIISASGANVAVRWEMMANPSLSNEKDLAEENFDEGEDLFVLYEDAIVDKSFNPNPLA